MYKKDGLTVTGFSFSTCEERTWQGGSWQESLLIEALHSCLRRQTKPENVDLLKE